MILRVEPIVTTRKLRGPFDYRAPDGVGDIGVGSLVRIPFAGRKLLGVVVGLVATSELPDDKLATPSAVLDERVPAELVALASWVATEYCSTPARALSLVLPPGLGKVRPRIALHAARTDVPLEGERLTEHQRTLLEALPALASELAAHGGLRRLEARGLLTLTPRVVPRVPIAPPVGARAEPGSLTDEQLDALAALVDGEAHLLHGVTGSGKTEVYLRAASKALAAGRGVLVLVPEIALTPQTVDRFRMRFGDTVCLLHSALGEGERYDEWLRLARGEARVAVGPRSAVWAPVADLGLVVVDEEHDGSYKHEGDPRYDARTVAQERARRAGATLIAGSATPRPESVHRLRRIRMLKRVDGQPLPPVRLVDMRAARGALHPDVRAALTDVRAYGQKAIVLLNRRGWSNFVCCRTCGKTWECPNCDVSLVLHRAAQAIECHHCGHRQRVPSRCDACGSLSVARFGAGTEQVEHELARDLAGPDFPVLRLDADIASGKDAVARTLHAFGAAPAGVLLGTQMVAKGHDFPDVTLGVVLEADSTLNFPDFRAEERTFALVAQLAGRAGRGPGGGRVLVQTLAPDAPSIALAAGHDADGFLRGELARREALRYPPYADLVRVVCSAEDAAAAQAASTAIAEHVAGAPLQLLGPAPLFRLRGKSRWQLLAKTSERASAVAAIGAAVDVAVTQKAHRDVAFSVDVDPQ